MMGSQIRDRLPAATLLCAAVVTCGCAAQQHPHEALFASAPAGQEFVVPGNERWTATDVFLHRGDLVELSAAGKVRIARWSWFGHEGPRFVGPEGTYDYPHEITYEKFPAPAAGSGPAAPYGLIARIGESARPLAIGSHRVFNAPESGRLYLGINDHHLADNRGAFHVGVRLLGNALAPPDALDARASLSGQAEPHPVEDARVLMIFVDGLRYDALKEMAFAGYLPNFRKIFFDGGIDVGPTFTVAPSNTIVATTAALTGSWPDRTGLFAQLILDREEGEITYLARPEGPVKAVEHIKEAWWQAPFKDPERPPLFKKRIEDEGYTFRSTVIPVMPDFPPDRYVQRVANEMPLFGAHLVKDYYFDAAETAYALDDVIEHDSRVMFVYYTGVDSAAHRSTRAHWGESRRDIFRVDRNLGKLMDELERENLANKTYWVLWADHGFTGGRDFIPQSWDVANDLLYRHIVDADRDRVPDTTGGLGMNVMYQLDDVTLTRKHTDVDVEDFSVCVTQAFDHGWIALPKGSSRSRDWKQLNTWHDLTHYQIHPDFEPVDIPQRLLDAVSERGNLYQGKIGDHPVAFVLVAMPPDKVMVVARESKALIERRRVEGSDRRFEYRYTIIDRIEDSGARLELVEARAPRGDPLNYTSDPSMRDLLARDPNWLREWHDDREWLAATGDAFYPDAVVAYTHSLLNDPDLRRVEDRARYDMAIVAAPGWDFTPGEHPAAANHGGADRFEKRIPFLISGPNLPKGVRVDRPARIIDVIPTALELADIDYDPASMDGQAVREIWGPPEAIVARAPEPLKLHHDDIVAVPLSDDEIVHGSVGHDPRRWYDLHNITANLATITSQEVLRMVDRTADVLIPGNEVRPTESGLTAVKHGYGQLPDSKWTQRPADLIDALRIHTITIGELTSPTQSLQHIDRIALTIDWLRNVINDPFGEPWPKRFTPVTPIDVTLKQISKGLLAGRRVLLEWAQRGTSAAIRGVEGAYRATTDATEGHEWETASVWSDDVMLASPAEGEVGESPAPEIEEGDTRAQTQIETGGTLDTHTDQTPQTGIDADASADSIVVEPEPTKPLGRPLRAPSIRPGDARNPRSTWNDGFTRSEAVPLEMELANLPAHCAAASTQSAPCDRSTQSILEPALEREPRVWRSHRPVPARQMRGR